MRFKWKTDGALITCYIGYCWSIRLFPDKLFQLWGREISGWSYYYYGIGPFITVVWIE